MNKNWKDYFNDREISDQGDHFLIKPKFISEIIPLICSNCDFLYQGLEDEMSHHNFGCCSFCELHFAKKNEKEWKNGWRPLQEEVEKARNNKRFTTVVF